MLNIGQYMDDFIRNNNKWNIIILLNIDVFEFILTPASMTAREEVIFTSLHMNFFSAPLLKKIYEYVETDLPG